MRKISLRDGWRFHLGDEENAFETGFDDGGWREVTVPHDWSVEYPKSRDYSSGTGYVIGGTAWYRKSFIYGADENERVFLRFDGVYKNSSVWINGCYLGKRPNGYVSFRYDVSEYIHPNCVNVIAVRVEHEDISDSRWFTGSGIYAGVELECYTLAYPSEYGIFFRTECTDGTEVKLECELAALDSSDEYGISAVLYDEHDGAVLSLSEKTGLTRGKYVKTTLSGVISEPRLWSDRTPYLYTLRVYVTDRDGNTSLIDEERVGVRSIRFDPNHGFFLNGRKTLLKGVCVHHDAGALGAAVTKGVWRRRLEKLKKMGCNAIRMSHNPHIPELYELCDELGFLVMDEAFDEWEGCKNKWHHGHNVYPPRHRGYSEDFPEWHERDLTSMVRRDRNHPSVIMWSVGNEIDYPNDPYNHPSFTEMTGNNDANKPEEEKRYNSGRPNMERLSSVAGELCEIVKASDMTRPVTLAAAFPELSAQIGFIDPFDVVGYNYKEQLYKSSHEKYPDKMFLGSENGHEYRHWRTVLDSEYIAGQFLWTGIDFLGECAGWPIHSSSAGNLTTAGFEKERYYLRQSWWSEEPVIHLSTARYREGERDREWVHTSESWNYLPGELIEVRCYTNAGEPVLRLNGRAVGEENRLGSESLGFYSWAVPFEEGEIEAEAGGIFTCIETCGSPVQIKLKNVGYDSDDIVQLELTVLDSHGRRAVGNQSKISLKIEGEHEYLGMDNGDVGDTSDYRSLSRNTLDGRLMIYLRKKGELEVKVRAFCPALKEDEITV